MDRGWCGRDGTAFSKGKALGLFEPSPAEVKAKRAEQAKAAGVFQVALAASRDPKVLAAEAFRLYETFQPAIPPGEAGWGAPGELDIKTIKVLAGTHSH